MRKHQNKIINIKRPKGFTLVEVLVGVMIGLIGTIVIFQVFSVSEGQKRTATAGGDSQQNGTFALYAMEQDIRNAGSGLGELKAASLKCNVLAYNAAGSPQNFNFPLVPVLITSGGGGTASDRITTIYGNSPAVTTATRFGSTATPTADYVLYSNQGFRINDLVLAVEEVTVSPYPACSLGQVSAIPSTISVAHNSGASFPYNKPGGLGVTYTPNGWLMNLGIPSVNSYTVNTSEQLTVRNILAGTNSTETPVVEGIFLLRAQYGVDTNGDDVIDAWQNPTGAWADTVLTATQITQIKAIRIAVITASTIREKEDVTKIGFTLFGSNAAGATAVAVPIPLALLDAKIRYQSFETIIPIRNMIWNY